LTTRKLRSAPPPPKAPAPPPPLSPEDQSFSFRRGPLPSQGRQLLPLNAEGRDGKRLERNGGTPPPPPPPPQYLKASTRAPRPPSRGAFVVLGGEL